MVATLSENPILFLFIVAALGYFIGNIKIKGNSLGVAAILFTGLAFGTIDPSLQIPDIILQIGLSIFVYSIGLSSGPAFFAAYRKNGLRDFVFITAILTMASVVAALLGLLFGFSASAVTGIFAGSTTNTAALAGVIDLISNSYETAAATPLLEDVVVGYSFSYPMGVLGGMIAIVLFEKWLKVNYDKEAYDLRKEYPVANDLSSTSVLVTNAEITGITLRDLFKQHDWKVIFGRIKQDGQVSLAHWDMVLSAGDTVMIVGNQEELAQVTAVLGESIDSTLAYDRKLFDVQRIFISNPKVVGRTLASLNLNERYNAIITRIRRGDTDMLATGDTVLELGDRIRFIARREDLKALSAYFGDSYYASSKINLFSFGLGIALGLILGNIEFEFGSQISFKLGYAGGPLIVGLILGALRRTGPIVWTLPYSANVTLQQLGLILLLSTIGVRSGHAFVDSLSLEGLWYFMASGVISLLTAFSIMALGYKLMKIPFSLLIGMVANQPAILEFGTVRAKNSLPTIGFTRIFPIALILKIVIAQVVFLVLR